MGDGISRQRDRSRSHLLSKDGEQCQGEVTFGGEQPSMNAAFTAKRQDVTLLANREDRDATGRKSARGRSERAVGGEVNLWQHARVCGLKGSPQRAEKR